VGEESPAAGVWQVPRYIMCYDRGRSTGCELLSNEPRSVIIILCLFECNKSVADHKYSYVEMFLPSFDVPPLRLKSDGV